MTITRLQMHLSRGFTDIGGLWGELDSHKLRVSDTRVVHISYKVMMVAIAATAVIVSGVYLALQDLLKLCTLKRPG